MKFGQLTEYTLDIFLEKSYTKCGWETIPRPSSKKSKLSIICGSVVLKFYTVCFYFMPRVEGYQNILKLNSRPL